MYNIDICALLLKTLMQNFWDSLTVWNHESMPSVSNQPQWACSSRNWKILESPTLSLQPLLFLKNTMNFKLNSEIISLPDKALQ